MMKISVDRGRCTGLGICESLAPKHFEVDDEGTLVLLDENVTPEDLDAVRDAVASCPTEALSIQP
jgi:ferredoxin